MHAGIMAITELAVEAKRNSEAGAKSQSPNAKYGETLTVTRYSNLRLLELACVLVPLDHIASRIVNAHHGIM